MTLAQALNLMNEIVVGRTRWGRNFSVPYTQSQLYDAITILHREGKFVTDDKVAIDPADVTKLRRQLAACQNREKRRKDGDSDAEAVSAQIIDDSL